MLLGSKCSANAVQMQCKLPSLLSYHMTGCRGCGSISNLEACLSGAKCCVLARVRMHACRMAGVVPA
jgi:hypothetical protein